MLKHSKIINALTVEQRLRLVFSSQKFERNPIPEFDFNKILIEKNAFLNRHEYFTYFPSNKSLATSWNNEIFKKAGKFSAIENNTNKNAKIFDLLFDSKDSSASEDGFFNGKFLSSFVEGAKQGKGITCIRLDTAESSNFENKQAPFNYAIASNPDAIIVSNLDDINFLKQKRYHENGLLFGENKDVNVAISLLQFGASIVFVEEKDYETLISQGLLAIDTYANAIVQLNNGSIDEAQVNALLQSGKALDEEVLNLACDTIVEILCIIDDSHKNQVLEPNANFYPKTHKVVFDEIAHDGFSVEASRQSIVLLKNEGVLPIKYNQTLSVIGDLAKNPEYYYQYSGRKEIYTDLVFDCINNYEELNAVGFVHGYLKGDKVDNDLILKARKLANTTDKCVVFLCAEKDEESLPEAQIELLRQLSLSGKKVIAVVVANKLIDFSFESYCSALLFSYDLGQGFARGVLDILTGRVSPSGKMVETSSQENVDFIPNYSVAKSVYPFGFGLSYSKFSYSNFSVSHAGVSVTIENVGNMDAYETVQLYVAKEGSKISHSNKQLKGFAKVFVKVNQKERVFIPFDDYTFNVYNERNACYEIEGGKYKIYLGDSYSNDKFVSTLKLKKFSNQTIFKNRVLAEGDERAIDKEIIKLADDANQQKIIKKNALLSYKQKIGLSLFLFLYFNIMSFMLVFSHFKDFSAFEIDLFTLIVICADAVLSLISLICMFVYISKSKKPVYLTHDYTNDTLSNIVDRVGEFKQESITTFIEEVEPTVEVEEENVEEAIQEEDDNIDDIALILESHEEVERENTKLSSLNDVFTKYSEFIQSKGLFVEKFYLRSVFSAILTSQIIFINSQNRQTLEKFILATQEFFACEQRLLEISNDSTHVKDLLLAYSGETRGPSDFAINLAKASNSDNLSIFAFADLSIEKVTSCLVDFVIFSDNPSISRTITLNDNFKIELKKNIVSFIIPSEEDWTEIMPEYLSRASVSITLPIKDINEETSCEYQPMILSYKEIVDDLNEIKNTCFIEESYWKLYDELEELLILKERFPLGNKFTIFAENFSSIFIDCHGEEYDASDAIIAYKLLPVLKTLNLYKKNGGDEEVTSMLEKVFTKDNLEKTLANIKKIVKEVVEEQPINEDKLEETVETETVNQEVVEELPVNEEGEKEIEPLKEETIVEVNENVLETVNEETDEGDNSSDSIDN